jgi:hypothetical protein
MAGSLNVTMPDGVTIMGIPEGTSKEDIMAKYNGYNGPPLEEGEPFLSDSEEDVVGVDDSSYINPKPRKTAGLEGEPLNALLDTVGVRESSNNYKAVNRGGYSGRYQFGAAALVDAGFLDRKRYDAWDKSGRQGGQKAFMNDDDNWTTDGGKKEWLNDKGAQDEAMLALMQINYDRLIKKRVITKSTPPREVAGLLMVAHLGGWSNAVKLAKDKNHDFKDANGTSIKEYYKLGVESFVPEEPTTEKQPAKESSMEKLEDGVYQDDAGDLFVVKGGKVEPYAD